MLACESWGWVFMNMRLGSTAHNYFTGVSSWRHIESQAAYHAGDAALDSVHRFWRWMWTLNVNVDEPTQKFLSPLSSHMVVIWNSRVTCYTLACWFDPPVGCLDLLASGYILYTCYDPGRLDYAINLKVWLGMHAKLNYEASRPMQQWQLNLQQHRNYAS